MPRDRAPPEVLFARARPRSADRMTQPDGCCTYANFSGPATSMSSSSNSSRPGAAFSIAAFIFRPVLVVRRARSSVRTPSGDSCGRVSPSGEELQPFPPARADPVLHQFSPQNLRQVYIATQFRDRSREAGWQLRGSRRQSPGHDGAFEARIAVIAQTDQTAGKERCHRQIDVHVRRRTRYSTRESFSVVQTARTAALLLSTPVTVVGGPSNSAILRYEFTVGYGKNWPPPLCRGRHR